MDRDRGWTTDESVLLEFRSVMWVAERQWEQPGAVPSVRDVATALGVDAGAVVQVNGRLRASGLLWGDEPPLVLEQDSARLNDQGLALAGTWRAAQQAKARRRAACRDSLLTWLDDHDGEYVDTTLDFEGHTSAHIYGSPFTADEIEKASSYLENLELIEGVRSMGYESLARPEITDSGRACVERYDSSVAAWEDRKLGRGGDTTNISVTDSHAVAIANQSPHATQKVIVTSDVAEQVANIIQATEQMEPVLGLSADRQAREREVLQELRDIIGSQDPQGSRLRAALESLRDIVVSGTGTAAGTAIVSLIENALGSL